MRQYLLAPSKGFGAAARSLERLVASLGRATLAAVYDTIIIEGQRKQVVVCIRTTIGLGANNYAFRMQTTIGSYTELIVV